MYFTPTLYVLNECILKGFFDQQEATLVKNYSKPPMVLITATHPANVGDTAAERNVIANWIEVLK